MQDLYLCSIDSHGKPVTYVHFHGNQLILQVFMQVLFVLCELNIKNLLISFSFPRWFKCSVVASWRTCRLTSMPWASRRTSACRQPGGTSPLYSWGWAEAGSLGTWNMSFSTFVWSPTLQTHMKTYQVSVNLNLLHWWSAKHACWWFSQNRYLTWYWFYLLHSLHTFLKMIQTEDGSIRALNSSP